MLVKQYLFGLKMYKKSMNDELSGNIKKNFMLPLMIELQDHKEKVSHNGPVYHKVFLITPQFPVL